MSVPFIFFLLATSQIKASIVKTVSVDMVYNLPRLWLYYDSVHK